MFNNSFGKFFYLIKLKFLFVLFKLIILLCIYFTFDENIFSGLSMLSERNDENYKIARAIILAGLTIFYIFALIELLIVLLGYTIKFFKNNIIILTLNIFSVYLLLYFILDGWHYGVIWYIFIIGQIPQTILELYGIIYSLINHKK